MLILLDIGNTHTHLGLSNGSRVLRCRDFPTADWRRSAALSQVRGFVGKSRLAGVAACSVVPWATIRARRTITGQWPVPWFELNSRTARCAIGIRYPRPATIGADRLANVIAARHRHGAPCLAIDFGTAVTFDVVDRTGCFVGGLIAPGISLMTHYLHEQTALLPEVRPGPVRRAIGRSTTEAIRIATVRGFRGLVRELIRGVKAELGARTLPVVATGGYARLIARDISEITAVEPHLTLEGLRLAWQLNLETGCRRLNTRSP